MKDDVVAEFEIGEDGEPIVSEAIERVKPVMEELNEEVTDEDEDEDDSENEDEAEDEEDDSDDEA